MPSGATATLVKLTQQPGGSYTGNLITAVSEGPGAEGQLVLLNADGIVDPSLVPYAGAALTLQKFATPPISSTAGTAGTVGYNGSSIYLCTVSGATGSATWVTVALSPV